jgi:hypothetical protein
MAELKNDEMRDMTGPAISSDPDANRDGTLKQDSDRAKAMKAERERILGSGQPEQAKATNAPSASNVAQGTPDAKPVASKSEFD